MLTLLTSKQRRELLERMNMKSELTAQQLAQVAKVAMAAEQFLKAYAEFEDYPEGWSESYGHLLDVITEEIGEGLPVVSVDDAVLLLNSALAADPDAMRTLINTRIPCNQVLAEHPTIQAGKTETGYDVGMLGVINGLFGALPMIAAYADERGSGWTSFIRCPSNLMIEEANEQTVDHTS